MKIVDAMQELPGRARLPRVGDRVRVDLPAGRCCDECPHFGGESGRIGRIVRDRPVPGAPSHPFLVIFDRLAGGAPCVRPWTAIVARHYAADELEHLA